MQTKKCSKCGKLKPISGFYKDKRTKGSHLSPCKECHHEYDATPERKRKRREYQSMPKYKKKWHEYTSTPEFKEKWRKRHREYNSRPEVKERKCERRKNNPMLRLNHTLGAAISRSLKGNKNGHHWEDIVGYTLKNLMRHLEKLFQPGMNWDNYGKGGWSIDHVIAKSHFNYTSPEDLDFKRCWALSNLQPLWEIDNFTKNATLDVPFQPAFAF